ncbi:MAG: phosphatase PAP2 family protein [Sulfuriferula sp.]
MKAIFYDWGGLNVTLFHSINNFHPDNWDSLMLMGTMLANHQLFPLYLAALSLFAVIAVSKIPTTNFTYYQQHTTLWVNTLAVFSIAYVLDGYLLGMLKPLLDFPRPPLALPIASLHIIGAPEFHHSLPSGHSSFAMLVIASIWPILRHELRILGVFFILWVGISRISLGAHFPADVMAGWASSLFIVLLVRWVLSQIQPRYLTGLQNKRKTR